MSLPADIKDLRSFVRRLLLAEALQAPGRPGPLEPPPATRSARLRRMRGQWASARRLPRSGRR